MKATRSREVCTKHFPESDGKWDIKLLVGFNLLNGRTKRMCLMLLSESPYVCNENYGDNERDIAKQTHQLFG